MWVGFRDLSNPVTTEKRGHGLFQLCKMLPADGLRRADTVVAARVVRLQGFAKIGQTACERESLDRNPNGVRQIRAGFHHDGNIESTRDVKPKLIALHSKIGGVSLD